RAAPGTRGDMAEPDVLIVGAGLAGLGCALRLYEVGIPFRIVEASDGVGGRVRTDALDGFQLDRGFQVLLTASPEARRVLDSEPLALKPFYHGALIRCGGRFHRVADPRRHLLDGLRGVVTPIGTPADKFRLLTLVSKVTAGKAEDQLRRPEG